jgi:hypothetical protein
MRFVTTSFGRGALTRARVPAWRQAAAAALGPASATARVGGGSRVGVASLAPRFDATRFQPPRPARAIARALSTAAPAPAAAPLPEGVPIASLTVGVPRETAAGERRVALTPEVAGHLLKAGFGRVVVEAGAGAGASFRDADYAAAGAVVVPSVDEVLASDVVLKARESAGNPGRGGLDTFCGDTTRGSGGFTGGHRAGPRAAPQHTAPRHHARRGCGCPRQPRRLTPPAASCCPLPRFPPNGLQVRPPTVDEARKLKPSGLLVSFVYPAQQPELLGALK